MTARHCHLLRCAGTCFAHVTQAYFDSCTYMLAWTYFAAGLWLFDIQYT